MAELKNIPLKNIRSPEKLLRPVRKDTVAYAELVESVKIHGVIDAICVRPDPENPGDYLTMNGNHRVEASKDAGKETIPAQVFSNVSDMEAYEKTIVGNAQRVETRPVEYSRYMQHMLDLNPTMTLGELAKRLGKSETWLKERLKLPDLIELAATLTDEGKIALANAQALAKLPEEEQEAFVEQAMTEKTDVFVPTVAKRLQEIQAARRQGRKPAVHGFQPQAHVRKVSDIQVEIENLSSFSAYSSELDTPVKAYRRALEYAINLDPNTVEAEKSRWEEKKKQLEAEKARAKAERLAKAQAEAAATVAAMNE